MTLNGKKAGKVLIVNDCARKRQAIRSTVEDLAGEIIESEEGPAALAACLKHKPDWVTMDFAIHPMTGLVDLWQFHFCHPLTHIILVAAHDAKTFREAARRAGARGYVLEIDLAQIRNMIAPAGATTANSTGKAGLAKASFSNAAARALGVLQHSLLRWYDTMLNAS